MYEKQVLPEPTARQLINDIIFGELVHGVFTNESRECFKKVILDLAARKATAGVLGCTEIPLLIGPGESPIPALDSTRLLARAALDEAVGGEKTTA